MFGGILVCHSFFISNGVRMLSLVLFAVYLDGLLQKLTQIGVGCYWGTYFVCTVCYADNIALLAPSPQTKWSTCEDFAESHGLKFNPEKTQLVRFGLFSAKFTLDLVVLY